MRKKNEYAGFFSQIKRLPASFWVLNIIQMLESLLFWAALIQLPIYISQKDIAGGLHWEQTVKGIIFFWWALVQRMTAVFAGGFADKYGYKRVLSVSFMFIITGYVLIGTQREFYTFLMGTLVLGFGSGIFKPVIQGCIAHSLESRSASIGWGFYVMLINASIFIIGPLLIGFLKRYEWQIMFISFGLIFSVNFIFLLVYRDFPRNSMIAENPLKLIKLILKNLFKSEVIYFILTMSGYTIIYMQFYETLPNFIYDWIDTSQIAKTLMIPGDLLRQSQIGGMIPNEWLYALNSGLIVVFVVYTSYLLSKVNRMVALSVGVGLASVGLMICGITMSGGLLIAGIIIYTTGEMITNPKFNEHFAELAPRDSKALYMSYLNISWGIGLSIGSLAGGWLYKHFGEKSSLAARYLSENFKIDNIGGKLSIERLMSVTGLDAGQVTEMLWSKYHPYILWLPFLVVGLMASLLLLRRGR
jgi:MFS family permease